MAREKVLLFLISIFFRIGGGTQICIVGAGIAGSSLSHFLREYSNGAALEILIVEKNNKVGGRMATVDLLGDTLESGASVLHPKNLHALNFTSLLGLKAKPPPSLSSLGIWNGSRFIFRTLPPPKNSPVYRKIFSFVNSLLLFRRYGVSLLRMQSFVKNTLGKFMNYYKDLDSRPVFESPEKMLAWAGLQSLTERTLREELSDAGLSPLLISELVTIITRINYGQSVEISGLAGAVSLAGSDSGLWSVEGGNWQLAAGLIARSNVTLRLNEEITSIIYKEGKYELESDEGNQYVCDVAVLATPLDETSISFSPPISFPERKSQHTHATFVRGRLDPEFFGLDSESEIPDLVGTMEVSEVPFSSIGVWKKYDGGEKAYKVFSRALLDDEQLDRLFRVRRTTVRIDWAAYPHYRAPEVFAPFILDGRHLYYVNAFESAASTMETSAVAAENIARLVLSRISEGFASASEGIGVSRSTSDPHVDL